MTSEVDSSMRETEMISAARSETMGRRPTQLGRLEEFDEQGNRDLEEDESGVED